MFKMLYVMLGETLINYNSNSLSWHGMVIHFPRELLAPSWCCALFLSYVMCTHDLWFLHGRDVLLFMWYICCLLPIMSENGLWIWRLILSAWHQIRWRPFLPYTLYDVFCTLSITIQYLSKVTYFILQVHPVRKGTRITNGGSHSGCPSCAVCVIVHSHSSRWWL